jgi:hypothetical protein
MQRHFAVPILSGILCLCALGATLAQSAPPAPPDQASGMLPAEPQAPSRPELKRRTEELIANQHANDKAATQYEYIERRIDRSNGSNPRTIEEKTFRVVPTGSGSLKILLKSDGKQTDPADYQRQLRDWQRVLELALRPNDPREQNAEAKFEKKRRDRAELVDATREAFSSKWIGRETVAGRDCDVFDLTPNREFHPHSMLQEALLHFTAKVWVDHDANQIVRAQARCIKDISVGGGILGKLYRGGVFDFEQAPVAPGIWLPMRYQYDFSGRKFLFGFEVHQVVESGHYRRVGPPQEALAVVKNEIAAGKGTYGDP